MKKHPKDVTLADLGTLATKDLLAVYNYHAPEPIARFADHPSAFRRTKNLLESVLGKAAPKPAAPAEAKPAETKPPKPRTSEPRRKEGERRKAASCTVLVAPTSKPTDTTEYHSVAAAFKALKLPMEKHQRFRREVKVNGKATFDKFIFTSTKN